MDAGINGDFEYLINESSPASKPAFELVSNPSSLFFARISLSLSFIFYFILILPLYPRSSFFFFRSSIIARTNIIPGGYYSIEFVREFFSGVHPVSFESTANDV